MTPQEFARVTKMLMAYWPGTALDQANVQALSREILDQDFEAVSTVINVLARSGRERMPPPGLLRKRLAELQVDAPPWGVAVDQLRRWLDSGVGGVYADFPRQAERIKKARAAMHPVVDEFVRHLGNRSHQIREGLSSGSDEARLRNKWEAFVVEQVENVVMRGLPAAPGMRRIERANDAPTQIGGPVGEVLAALKPGSEA